MAGARVSDPIRETRVLQLKGGTAYVHFPDISDTERERRMQLIYDAVVDLNLALMRHEALGQSESENKE